MRAGRFARVLCGLAAVASGGVLPSSARGDVVVDRSGGVLFGQIVAEDGEQLVIRQRIDAAQSIERRLNRGEVAVVIRTIDPQRLAALDPRRPAAYEELAEELAVLAADPEARALAIRLYLIAGSRITTTQTRRRIVRALVTLARHDAEELRFRELAYAEDPTWPESDLALRRPRRAEPTAEQLVFAIATLRAVRQGRGEETRAALGQADGVAIWEPLLGGVRAAELQEAAGASPLTARGLASVLRAELALERRRRGDAPPAAPTAGDGVDWPRWESVSEFDPRQSVYRDGQWRLPEASDE